MDSSLKDYQHLLAKIYTDAVFRQKFFENPEKVGQAYRISSEIALKLAQECKREINFYSRSLIGKRLGIVKNFFPDSFRLFSSFMEEAYRVFAAEHSLGKNADHYAQDAFEFGKFLLKNIMLFKEKNIQEWQKELICFETLQIRLEKSYLRCQIFRYDLPSFLQKADKIPKPDKKIHLFIHLHWGGRVWRRFF